MPILNNQDNNSEQEENEPVSEDDLNVSDWDDVDDTNKDSDEEIADDSDVEEADEAENDFHWSDICRNWIHLTECENQFDNEEDNQLLEMTHFHAAERNIHPANDEIAKWRLEYLFKENIKAPTFLGIEINSPNYNNSA